MSQPLFSIVVSCHGSCPELDNLVGTIECQEKYGPSGRSKSNRVPIGPLDFQTEIVICSDGPYHASDKHTAHTIVECKKASPSCWGHNTRGPGIEAATGDWVILTNADNLFVYGALHRISQAIAVDVGAVTFDMVHSQWGWTGLDGCHIGRNKIDLSAIAVRSEFAKKVGFPYRVYDGDFEYIQQCVRSMPESMRHRHISEQLFVHC